MARRVDTLMRVDTADSGSHLLTVEAQGRPDPDKLNSWTYYLAYLYAEYKLPPVLLVVCQDKPTASWAAQPLRIGLPAHTSIAVFPLVLGPENLPTIIDPDGAAEDLALAVSSALAHANDPALPAILEALATALANIGGETAQDWAEYTEIGLGDTHSRAFWRHLMTFRPSRFPAAAPSSRKPEPRVAPRTSSASSISAPSTTPSPPASTSTAAPTWSCWGPGSTEPSRSPPRKSCSPRRRNKP